MKYTINITALILTVVLVFSNQGCGIIGGIKGYRYAITKYKLEKAVNSVIRNNPDIYRDTSNDKINDSIARVDSVSNNDGLDRVADYNNGYDFVTITINTGAVSNKYIFRYYGDAQMWKNSPTSEIFICFAYDKFGNGGRGADISGKMAKQFTDIFEKEFVSKLDEELHLYHIETE